MNLEEMNEELKVLLRDPTVEQYFTQWLNDCVQELAYEFELPGLRLKLPATLTTTTTNWQYLLSAATPPATGHAYMKKVFKITNTAHEHGMPIYRDVQEIDRIDPDHDETGNDVEQVAVEDETDDATVAIYPKAADTLNLWYYRQPITMTGDNDIPDGIPAAFHYRVLMPKAVLRAFRVFPELATETPFENRLSLVYWQGKLREGLYGDGFEIGMVHALQKSQNPPRVRGPRFGANLAGSDRYSTRRRYGY